LQGRVGVRRSDRLLADEIEEPHMTRIALVIALGLLLVGSSYSVQNEPQFTGRSVAMDGKDLSVARRSFHAGSRTYWHSHEKGQLFLVEDGRMRTQKKGGPMKE